MGSLTGKRRSPEYRERARLKQRRYYAANPLTPEKKAERYAMSRAWVEQNVDHVRAVQKAWKTRNAAYYKQYSIFSGARRRAKQSGLAFEITFEDVNLPEVCPVFGMPLHLGEGKNDFSPSLDRIDNSRGYVPGNIVVVSELANRMKSNATVAQMRRLADFYQELQEKTAL